MNHQKNLKIDIDFFLRHDKSLKQIKIYDLTFFRPDESSKKFKYMIKRFLRID